jgi:uncharacterized protein involved in exopolysaccharide biosynthesis/Mrp family chromosome partitioning ATPase
MSASSHSAPLDVQQLARVLARRKWLVIVPWGISMVFGTLLAFLLPPIYFSSVTLQFDRPQTLSGPLGGMVSGSRTAEQQLNIMRGQAQSSLFLRSVVTATGIKTDPATRAWAAKRAKAFPGLAGDDLVEAALVDFLRDAVSIRVSRGDFLSVTVGDHDPERARRLVDGVANQFVVSSKAAQLEALRATQEFSAEQQQVYKEKLQDAERRLESARRLALESSLTGSSVNTGNLGRARTLLDQIDLEVEQQRQRLAGLRGQFPGRVQENDPRALTSGEISSLAAQISTLERQLGAALLGGGDGGAARTSLAHKTLELEDALTREAARRFPAMTADNRDLLVRYRGAEIDLEAREARRAYLAGQVSGFERQVAMTPDLELDVQRLQQEVENARALYNSFLQQSAATQINEAFENAKLSGRFRVIEPARRPLSPGKPNRPILVLLAFLAGGVIGIGTVLLVEQHDQSMRNAEEVENLLGLPVLGTVPRVEELERSHRRSRTAAAAPHTRDVGLLHRLKVESALGLEFRRIYLKLARTRGRAMPRTLLLTSATRGEGKTTTAACLAITLSRELREKTLLVDFDLRSPALHRALGLPSSSWGLAQMLHTHQFDERYVRSTVLPTLDFLGAGKSERPAAEIVDLGTVEWFLGEASKRYPLVLIDGPPNLAVPDPLILGRAVEGVIYVIKAGSTIRKAAEYGVRVQREARDNVLGVLMNDVGEILPQYYGYRQYGYGAADEAIGNEPS